MPDDMESRSAIVVSERPTVMFEPVFPPDSTRKLNSYFGGKPRLPVEIQWPVSEIVVDHKHKKTWRGRGRFAPVERAVASTFLAQIDLSELPAEFANALPNSGTLYFFLDSATEDLIFKGEAPSGGRVIYWPGDSSTIEVRPEPDELAPCFGKDWINVFTWLTHISSTSRKPFKSFPKWVVRPRVIQTHDLAWHFERISFDRKANESAEQREEHDARVKQYLAHSKALGDVLRARNNFVSHQIPLGPQRNYFLDHSELRSRWRGEAGFPYSWIDVEVFCGSYIAEIHKKLSARTSLQHALSEVRFLRQSHGFFSRQAWQGRLKATEALARTIRGSSRSRRRHRDIQRIEQDARCWVERAAKAGRYAELSVSARQEFWRWYDAIIARGSDGTSDPRHWTTMENCIGNAYRVGPRLSLAYSQEAASLVPASWLEHQRWQWAIRYKDDSRDRTIRHQLLGPREYEILVDPNPNEKPSVPTIPLMSFDSQDGLFWEWGDVGMIEFRIPEAALAARDFSKCFVELKSG